MTAPYGDAVYLLTLTVIDEGQAPCQTHVGNGVLADSLPALLPGSRLQARKGDGAGNTVVDGAAAPGAPCTAAAGGSTAG